jgi:hypothetical protein
VTADDTPGQFITEDDALVMGNDPD